MRFAYAYDGAGNRTKAVQGGQTVTTTYDSTGLPETTSDGLSYTFDAIGQMRQVASASDQSKRRAYANDAYGRLVRAVMGSTDLSASPAEGITRIDYGVDALGRTASRTQAEVVSGSTVTTTTDSAFRAASEDYVSQAVGGVTTSYAYSPGGPLAQQVGNGAPSFYAKNLHGDVVGLVSASGVAGSQSYSPYGEPRNQIGDKASIGFQGDPTDPKTGLVDMNTRNYDPSMGRFVTQDILLGDINSPMGMNQYLYGNGSPITFSDPTGMRGVRGSGMKHAYICGYWENVVYDPSNCYAPPGIKVNYRTIYAWWGPYYWDHRRESARPLALWMELTGGMDIIRCGMGKAGSCGWTFFSMAPVGRLAKGIKGLAFGAKHMDEGVDVARGLGLADDAARVASHADEVVDVASRSGDLTRVAGDSGVTVVGHTRSGYKEVAKANGYRYFDPPQGRWTMDGNMTFIERTARRGDRVLLTDNYWKLLWEKGGSTTQDEVMALTMRYDYTVSPDGMWLLPPGM